MKGAQNRGGNFGQQLENNTAWAQMNQRGQVEMGPAFV